MSFKSVFTEDTPNRCKWLLLISANWDVIYNVKINRPLDKPIAILK